MYSQIEMKPNIPELRTTTPTDADMGQCALTGNAAISASGNALPDVTATILIDQTLLSLFL